MANNTETPEQQIARLQAELASKNSELAESQQINAEQAQKLKLAETGVSVGGLVVSHEDKQYQVMAQKFTIDGELVTADQLKDDAELIGKLIEANSGLLVLVAKEEKKA